MSQHSMDLSIILAEKMHLGDMLKMLLLPRAAFIFRFQNDRFGFVLVGGRQQVRSFSKVCETLVSVPHWPRPLER